MCITARYRFLSWSASSAGPMPDILKPETDDQLRDAVLWAAAEETPLELIGHGTKRSLGAGGSTNHVLDLSALAGVVDYQPEELVLTARACTSMLEIDSLLAARGQMLAFEPQDWGHLLSGRSNPGTLGGAVMSSSNGPRRIKAGAVRDHLLGFAGVSGRGEAFKAGGKVVKNVTGYDLSKLVTGSWGTLAAVSELTLKVLPAPEKTYTLLLYGEDARRGLLSLRDAARTAYEVSGLAYVPADAAALSAVRYVREPGEAVTALRLEGPEISVKHRFGELKAMLGEEVETEELHTHNSRKFWTEIRDVRLLPVGGAVWRVSLPSTEAPAFLDAIQPAHWVANWAGGLLWLHEESTTPDRAQAIRNALTAGGQAMLVRAEDAAQDGLPAFQPLEPGLAALNRRVKENFDPHGILNPGRMG